MSLPHASNILVVDDSRTIRTVVEAILRENGVTSIALASDGLEAFNCLEKFTPDLIILDVSMPNMDGLEFCTRLRKSNHPAQDAQIIILTGLDNSDERVRALNAGVSGVLYKNTIQTSLIPTVRNFLQQAQLLKILRSGENISPAHLARAEKMLEFLLPSEELLQKIAKEQLVSIKPLYRPSEALSGDYWFVYPIDSDRVAIFVADYSGHGVTAAVNVFRLHTFMKDYARYHLSPSHILDDLNRYFYPMLPTGEYIVCFLGIVDANHRTMEYAAAGLPPAILAENGRATLLDCSGDVIGAYEDTAYRSLQSSYKEDTHLLLYTDALVEGNAQGNYLFTKDTLETAMEQNPAGIIDTIKKSHHKFDDDLTVLDVHLK